MLKGYPTSGYSMPFFRAFVKSVQRMWQLKPNTNWVKILKILFYTAVSQNEAKRSTSENNGLASVPEYEARAEEGQSSEMQLTVGTLCVYHRKYQPCCF